MTSLPRRLLEKSLHRDLQCFCDGREFVVENRAVPAFNLRDLRLARLHTQPGEAPHHILLRYFRRRSHAEPLNDSAGDVASIFAFFHSALVARTS